MDFKTTNLAIIEGKDVNSSFKNKEFYQYLLDNNVAYYYSKMIAQELGRTEKKILLRGEEFNAKYIKTLKEIYEAAKKGGIDFALFKTFKHIPEAVDGDIDVFVKEKDFDKFINLLRERGFKCIKETSFKAFCLKEGFCKVEPRKDISFHGKNLLSEEVIWNNVEKENIVGLNIFRSSLELDTYYFLLNSFYGPSYIRLYHYLIFNRASKEKIYSLSKDKYVKKDLKRMVKSLMQDYTPKRRFPLFRDNLGFLRFWLKRIVPERDLSLNSKLKNLIFFFYAKYGYIFLGRLPFRHDWKIY